MELNAIHKRWRLEDTCSPPVPIHVNVVPTLLLNVIISHLSTYVASIYLVSHQYASTTSTSFKEYKLLRLGSLITPETASLKQLNTTAAEVVAEAAAASASLLLGACLHIVQ